MKQRIIFVITLFLIFFSFGGFYLINENNYSKLKEINSQIINHPEFLPKKDISKWTSFGFANLRADIYWLEAIQYIGGNAIGSEYKKYLYTILDLITELNPYFEKPYIIGQLLLPNYNERYENLSKEKQLENIKQAEIIGLKGIKNFCDPEKIKLISNEDDLQKIWTEEKYKNPCSTGDIAFGQAFLYYFYLKNPEKSSIFYKIASANDDSLEGAKIMAAIMSGKSGNREKSIMMFLTLVSASNKDNNEICITFSKELEKISYATFRQGLPLTGELIKNLEKLRKENLQFDEKNEQKIVSGDNCENYINKAIREINLAYIEQGNKKYFLDKKENAPNAKTLFEKGYIDFLPIDFQQYKDYGIIYYFNAETGNFDYRMGDY